MKYIFIDTNQYRHIYSLSEGFSQEVYDLLIRLIDQEHVQLLLPQQTKDEVERNRFRAWPEDGGKDIEKKIDRVKKQIGEVTSDFGNYEGGKILLENLQGEIAYLEKEKDLIKYRFINLDSEQNKKINQLFEKAEILFESQDIIARAKLRQDKRNPPYGKDGRLGDLLIWECIIEYLHTKRLEHPITIFVSNDKSAWGDVSFDPWLENEYKSKTDGQIILCNRLYGIPDLTVEEQKRLREEEEENLKKNIISDFVNSMSFVGAGRNARKLLRIKNLLSEDDYINIITGAILNRQIYQSFFTRNSLINLLEGESKYVVKQVETVPADLWNRFEKIFHTGLSRQSDVNIDIDLENIFGDILEDKNEDED